MDCASAGAPKVRDNPPTRVDLITALAFIAKINSASPSMTVRKAIRRAVNVGGAGDSIVYRASDPGDEYSASDNAESTNWADKRA